MQIQEPFLFNGPPERIRTSDLCLRRAALYPAELRAVYGEQVAVSARIVYGFQMRLYCLGAALLSRCSSEVSAGQCCRSDEDGRSDQGGGFYVCVYALSRFKPKVCGGLLGDAGY